LARKRERRLLVLYYCREPGALLFLVLRGPDRVEGFDACLQPPCSDVNLPELGELRHYIALSPIPPSYTPPWLGGLEELSAATRPTPCIEELLSSTCRGLAYILGKLEKQRTPHGRREGR